MPTTVVEILLAAFVGLGIGLLLGAVLGAVTVIAITRHMERIAAERAAAIARDIIANRDAVEPPTKTEKRAIEQVMMTLAGQRERVDEDLARMRHMIEGGRFDDSPTKWKNKESKV